MDFDVRFINTFASICLDFTQTMGERQKIYSVVLVIIQMCYVVPVRVLYGAP
jgi:hypothetical protein